MTVRETFGEPNKSLLGDWSKNNINLAKAEMSKPSVPPYERIGIFLCNFIYFCVHSPYVGEGVSTRIQPHQSRRLKNFILNKNLKIEIFF